MIGIAAVLVLGAAAGPVPTPEPVPVEVHALARGPLVAQAREYFTREGLGRADTNPGAVHRVYQWSDDVRAGRETARPIEPTDTWMIVETSGGRPRAVGYVVRDAHRELVAGGIDGNAQMATALATLRDAVVVRGLPTRAFDVVSMDGTVVPLAGQRFPLHTEPVSLARAQALVAAAHAEDAAAAAAVAEQEGRPARAAFVLVGAALGAAGCALGVVLVVRRRRRLAPL